MDAYYHNQPPGSYLETIIDNRPSTAAFKGKAFWYMDQVHGWCSHQKASILVDLITKIRPAKIVEIGVWAGKSLIPMAYALKTLGNGKIYGIDPWSSEESVVDVKSEANRAYWAWVDHEAVMNGLIIRIKEFELLDQVELIRSTSQDAPLINDIDLLHIDGNHSEVTSYIDVTKWAPLVRPGGWIIVDDISWFEAGGFTQARSVEWLDQHCDRMGAISDVCTWGIWVKR